MGCERQAKKGTTLLFREVNVLQTALNVAHEFGIEEITSLGCSTGEEVYSLAYMAGMDSFIRFYGVDVDPTRIAASVQGEYTINFLPDQQKRTATIKRTIRKYCTPSISGQTWNVVIPPEIKDCTQFAVHDMTQSPLKHQTRLMVCANVLMHYWANPFDDQQPAPSMQENIYRSIAPNGFLVVDDNSFHLFAPQFKRKNWRLREDLAAHFLEQPTPSPFQDAVVLERLPEAN